eukprot:255844-Prymnesium_polylepis.1
MTALLALAPARSAQVPWAEYRTMLNRSEHLWRVSPSAQARLVCEGPPCLDCAHTAGQRACAIDVELNPPAGAMDTTSCWPKCQFVKTSAPELPAHCWSPQ